MDLFSEEDTHTHTHTHTHRKLLSQKEKKKKKKVLPIKGGWQEFIMKELTEVLDHSITEPKEVNSLLLDIIK